MAYGLCRRRVVSAGQALGRARRNLLADRW